MNRIPTLPPLLLLPLFALPVTSQAQVGRSLPRAVPDPNQPSYSGQRKSDAEVLPSFAGTVRGLDDKILTIERPDSNTMDFHCSKKTRYYDSNRQIKSCAIKVSDPVSVEVKRAPDGSLDAVNVRLERRKAP